MQIRQVIRYEGIFWFLWRYLVWLISPFGELKMVSLYRKDLTRPIAPYRAKVDIEISEATEDDLEQVYRIWKELPDKITDEQSLWTLRKTIARQVKQISLGRMKCFVGRVKGKVVHYNWIYFKKAPSASEDDRFVVLEDVEAHLNIAYTRKKWRGMGFHTAVQSEMLRYLQRSGYRVAYTFAPSHNKSSLKTHERLDWECQGIILRFRPKGSKKDRVWLLKGRSNTILSSFLGH